MIHEAEYRYIARGRNVEESFRDITNLERKNGVVKPLSSSQRPHPQQLQGGHEEDL